MAAFKGFCQIKSVLNTGAASASTIVFTPLYPVSANNGIVGWVGWNTAAGTLTSVTDSLGTAYTLGLSVNDATNGRTHQQFYSTKLAAGGAITITATLSGASANRTGQVSEYGNFGAFDGESMLFQVLPGIVLNAIDSGVVNETTTGGLQWGNTEATTATSGTLTSAITVRNDENLGPEFGSQDFETSVGLSSALFTQSVNANRITGVLAFKVASPRITVDPASQSKNRPDTATFSITATGAVSYQWQDDSSGVFANVVGGSGATTNTYTTPATTEAFNGRKYHCVTTNGSANVVNSGNATLTWAWVKDGVGRRTRGALGLGPLGIGSSTGNSRLTKLPETVNESAAATDTQTGQQALGAFAAETVSSADSVAAVTVFSCFVAETLSGVDSVTSAGVLSGSVAETLEGADSIAAAAVFVATQLEGAATTDAQTAVQVFAALVAESVQGTDAAQGGLQFPGSVAETLAGVDSVASYWSFGKAVAETLFGADSASAVAVFPGSVAEALAGVDSIAAAGVLSGFVAETLFGADSASAVAVFQGTVAETLAGVAAAAGFVPINATVAETLMGVASSASFVSFDMFVAEALVAADSMQWTAPFAVYKVVAEDRVLVLVGEARLVAVEGEVRVVAVEGEARLVAVEGEVRVVPVVAEQRSEIVV